MSTARSVPAWVAVLWAAGLASAADEPLSRSEITKRAKGATALLQTQPGSATAFCVHASGLFVTNQHAVRAQGSGAPTVKLVLDAGLRTQKVLNGEVVRVDKELDLALLRVAGQPALAALTLGSDEDLDELAELIAFGFPFGTALAKPGQFPTISVNLGSVTSLRRDEKGDLHRIQLDAELNPGNSGGPVLDRSGKVVGVTVGGIPGAGINMAIPVSHLKRFLARPEILFTPPVVGRARAEEPIEFRAEVVSVLPMSAPYDMELLLGPAGKGQKVPMASSGGAYLAKAVAFPRRDGPIDVRLTVTYDGGLVRGATADRDVRLGGESLKLSQARRIRLGEGASSVLWDARTVPGALDGLDALPLRVGPQTLNVRLAGATGINIDAPEPSGVVSCALVARQGGKEVGRVSAPIYLEGAEQETLDAIRDGRFRMPLRSQSPVTYLRAVSVTGDYIGQGKNYSYGESEMTARRDFRGVNVAAGGFNFQFGGPANHFLEAREYLDAKRHPFSGEAPGMEISGNGRASNVLEGKFVVWELAVKGNEVVRLAIDFSQRSEGKMPPFYGKLRINSNFH